MTDARVVDNREAGRFDIIVDGEPAGSLAYRRDGATIDLTHTRIEPAYEGRGLGSTLVRRALDAAREERLAVLPSCSFVRGFIQRHREYADLVPADERPRFDIGPEEEPGDG